MRDRLPNTRLMSYVAAAALTLLLAPLGTRAASAQRFVGWGTDGKVKVTYSSGAAHWNAEHRWLFIGFASSTPSSSDVASFLQSGWWPESMAQRGVNMYLEFGSGETAAALRALRSFTVSFFRYPTHPDPYGPTMHFSTEPSSLAPDVSDTFRQWGWRELTGELGPGGRVRGRVVFAHVFEDRKNHVGPIPYQWDLTFDVVAR